MTTSIFTELIEPMCEYYYKAQKSSDVYDASINTFKNYGFSTSFSINFGLTLSPGSTLSNIVMQPGVFTTDSVSKAAPAAGIQTIFQTQNSIIFSDLPPTSMGIITYTDKVMPIAVTLSSLGASIVGVSSNYYTDGAVLVSGVYESEIIRAFESSLALNDDFSTLIFAVFSDATFYGMSTNWEILPSSIIDLRAVEYRYNNGFGQFSSYEANKAFIPKRAPNDFLDELYISTYNSVYNVLNNLEWIPDFQTWFTNNPEVLGVFTKEFLSDYFSVTP